MIFQYVNVIETPPASFMIVFHDSSHVLKQIILTIEQHQDGIFLNIIIKTFEGANVSRGKYL